MLEVFTVGGGEYLVNTFNAIAAWTGSGGFKSLIRVVMVMGLIYALLVTAMNLDWRVWFRWFLQSTLIYSCLMVPTVTIKVTDRVNPGLAPATIANVPIGLGVMASFTSQVSDYLTRTAETVFVMPAQLQYSNGGFVYGARLWDRSRGFEVRDPIFKANLDTFIKQCSYYDILLGAKSLKDLSTATDLWLALGNDAAVNRGMKYAEDAGGGKVDFRGVTCLDAWRALDAKWATEIQDFAVPFAKSLYPKMTDVAASSKLSTDLPVVGNLLTGAAGLSRDSILRQKSMVDAFETAQLDFGDPEADAYALQRADTQSRNAMSTAAEQGMVWIPVLNIVLTIIFYAMFPVVFPLFLFPKTGVTTLKGYFAGFFYLAAWGPLYVLIHMFIMDRLVAQMNAVAAGGTSLINFHQMEAVNQDIATMAGFLMMSVPVLAMMIMRGTMSVVGSVGQMLSPVQQGSDAAALERTTGNYAYGDVSMANYHANNRQESQWQTAPNWTSGAPGFVSRTSDGRTFSEYGNGRPVVNASGGMDVLPFKPMLSRGYTSDLREQGNWYLNEADRIERGESNSWQNSRSAFNTNTVADSSATGRRWDRGNRSDHVDSDGSTTSTFGTATNGQSNVLSNRTSVVSGRRDSGSVYVDGNVSAYAGAGVEGKIGTPGEGLLGSGASASAKAGVEARVTAGARGSREWYGDNVNSADQTGSQSKDVTGGVRVDGTTGHVDSQTQMSGTSVYGDNSHTQTSSTGTDNRTTEADERRQAAAEYREIGYRMLSEASYAESHGFQVSQDMSNLVSDRYRQLQIDHPEMMLPELSDPNLDYKAIQRRDAGVQYVLNDLMGDLKSHRISELGDVAGIERPSTGDGGFSSLGKPGDGIVGVPAAPVLAPADVGADGGNGSGGGDASGYDLVPVRRGERVTLPVAGTVKSGLGGRSDPVSGKPSQHNGIDIAAPAGTPIVVQAGGVVVESAYQKDGAGNYVTIDHGNGITTRYFHMQGASPFHRGDRVDAGVVIGNVGSTGHSTGPHLHYEMLKDGAPVDARRFRLERQR